VSGQLDVYYTLIWGTRSALLFGLTVALTAGAIGIGVGGLSGYVGGATHRWAMRLTDAFLSLPVIAVVWMFEMIIVPPDFQETMIGAEATIFQRVTDELHLTPLLLSFVLLSWMPYARLVNASVAALKHANFVIAAQALGAGRWHILWRHLLPNAVTPALVLLARDIGGVVVLAATFTFIGIGTGSDWGALLVVGRNWIVGPAGNPLRYWWVYVPTTLVLVLFSTTWNLLGDNLSASLDPRHAAGQ
jgi:peptide/nickel transport system permease protein